MTRTDAPSRHARIYADRMARAFSPRAARPFPADSVFPFRITARLEFSHYAEDLDVAIVAPVRRLLGNRH